MPRYAIFDNKGCNRCFGIFCKQDVVPDTQSCDNIQVCFKVVENHGLANRIAHGFNAILVNLFQVVFFLICSGKFAAKRTNYEFLLKKISFRTFASLVNPTQCAIPIFR